MDSKSNKYYAFAKKWLMNMERKNKLILLYKNKADKMSANVRFANKDVYNTVLKSASSQI